MANGTYNRVFSCVLFCVVLMCIVHKRPTDALDVHQKNHTSPTLDSVKEIKLGGFFVGDGNNDSVSSFIAAIEYVNSRRDILPNVNLTYVMDTVPNHEDSLQVIQSACTLINEDVAVIIGPAFTIDVRTVYPIFSGVRIPMVSPMATDPALSADADAYPFLFKMSLPDTLQARALADLVKYHRWTEIAIIASSSDYGQNGVRLFQAEALKNKWTISFIEYFTYSENMTKDEFESTLKAIKDKGTRLILLNCMSRHARLILDQASFMGMTDAGWAWVVSDAITGFNELYPNCKNVPYHLRGLIGTRPPEPHGELYRDYSETSADKTSLVYGELYSTLVFDSVLVAAYGLHDYLQAGNTIKPNEMSMSACISTDYTPWPSGDHLRDYISKISGEGVTRHLHFTEEHYVPSPGYDIVNLQRYGWMKVGSWENKPANLTIDDNRVLFPGNTAQVPKDHILGITNYTFRVVSIIEAPYLMLDPDQEPGTTMPPRYIGYCIEFIEKLKESLHFKYDITLTKDGKFGGQDENGEWCGMMGELIRNEVDMILAPMTISYERETHVDFTKPFQDLGAIIATPRAKSQDNLLSFFDPFSYGLWLVTGVAFVVSGVVNSLVSWGSPYGHRGRYISRIREGSTRYKENRNYFNLWNSLWLSFSQWMNQGTEASPQSFSGRFVYGVWYFCVMIITATYTANLAAFMTVKRLETDIASLDDLAQQKTIKYGTVSASAVEEYFADKQSEPYATMSKFMNNKKTFVQTTEEGIRRVQESYGKPKSEQYAFIYDSAPLEYAASHEPCDMRIVGRIFNHFGYGLAFHMGSPFVNAFSLEILKLRQSGYMSYLEKKWLQSGSCDPTQEDSGSSDTQQASVGSMAGVFIFLVVGFAFVIPIIICEYIAAARQDAHTLYKRKEIRLPMGRALRRRCDAICGDFRRQAAVFMGSADPESASSEDEDEVAAYEAKDADLAKYADIGTNYGFEPDVKSPRNKSKSRGKSIA